MNAGKTKNRVKKPTRDWQGQDHRHHIHPFTNHYAHGRKGTRIITDAEGVYIGDSEAKDTNIKLVRRYWDLMGKPDKNIIISRVNAYHGSTVAGSCLSGMSAIHEQTGALLPGIVHIDELTEKAWHGLDLTADFPGLER